MHFQKYSKYFLYVGMTMRKFRDRIKEHNVDLRLNRPYTALSRLAQIQPIKVDFNKSKNIFRTNNYQEAILRESIEIIANKHTACNDELSCCIIDESWFCWKFEYLYLASHLTYNYKIAVISSRQFSNKRKEN